MFSFCGVDDGGAANLRDLVLVAVKRPTANLLTANHVFNKQNATVEAQTQLIKEFNVLQQIVIGGAVQGWKENGLIHNGPRPFFLRL